MRKYYYIEDNVICLNDISFITKISTPAIAGIYTFDIHFKNGEKLVIVSQCSHNGQPDDEINDIRDFLIKELNVVNINE